MSVSALNPPNIALPATGSYIIDPAHSRIDFTTRHLFGLAKMNGNFTVRDGHVVVATPMEASSVNAEADASSFTTGNAKRDDHVRSEKFLEVEQYPTLGFRSNRLVQDGDKWVLHGILTAHGREAPLALAVTTSAVRNDVLELEAVGTVDRSAHGITAMKGMIGRRLKVTVAVRATKQ